MASIPVGSEAVQLSGYLTERALLTNQGTVTIYLDTFPGVTPGSAGIALAPNQSMNSTPGQTLYAVTAGTIANLGILLGADTTLSPNVNATISTPVNVQGGGALLGFGSFNSFTGNETKTFTINGPSDGLTYYGIRLYLALPSAFPTTDKFYWRLQGADGTVLVDGNIIGVATAATAIYQGVYVDVTVPMAANYPLRLQITNLLAGPSSGFAGSQWLVWGVSAAYPAPVSSQIDFLRASGLSLGVGATTIALPPSFTPYYIKWRSATAPTALSISEFALDGTLLVATSSNLFPVFAGSQLYAAHYKGSGLCAILNLTAAAAGTAWFDTAL